MNISELRPYIAFSDKDLLSKWIDLSNKMDAIDYDDLYGDQPEFGGDSATLDAFIDMQVDELRAYEDDLEFKISEIESELQLRGFEVVSELEKVGKGYNWNWILKAM